MVPIFTICVRELPERTAYVQNHLAERGLPWEPWWGFPGVPMGLITSKPYDIDGHTPKPCPACGNETAYKLNPGTVAVTLSHLALLKHIVAAKYPAALIFENDVDLPLDFGEKFSAFGDALPAGWDLAYLGWGGGGEGSERLVAPGVAVIEAGSMQTHAYMVSARGAAFLDEFCQCAYRPIDVSYMLAARGRLKTFFAYPKIAEQLTATGRMDGSLHFGAEKFTALPPPPATLADDWWENVRV